MKPCPNGFLTSFSKLYRIREETNMETKRLLFGTLLGMLLLLALPVGAACNRFSPIMEGMTDGRA